MDLAATRLRWQLRWQRWRSDGPPLDHPAVLEARRQFDALGRFLGPPPGTTSEPTPLAGRDAEWVTPDGWDGDRWLLFLHGGGYCMGSIEASRWSCATFARALRARALLLDYRLGPEHPFPAGLTDAVEAYRQLTASGIPAHRVVVAGDSAGGGLAVATLLALRDAGDQLPAGAIAFSPWADLTCSSPSYHHRAQRDLSLTRPFLRFAAASYLDGHDPRDPLASPVFADLTGLPPLLLLSGTAEIVFDDLVALAENGRRAGVDVRSHIGWGMPHCWFRFEGQQGMFPSFLRERRRPREHPLARLFTSQQGADAAVVAMADFGEELLADE